MVDARRNRYLDAMGVDVWVRRPGGVLAGVWEALAGTEGIAAAELEVGEAAHVGVEAREVADVGAGGTAGDEIAAAALTAAEPAPVSPARMPAPAPAVIEPVSDDAIGQWDTLRSEILSCTKCPLHKTRTQGVVGVGPQRVNWMVIGEAPGAEEDRRGEPFVGRAGHLLDAMLHAIGLNRGTNVYIANVLKSRPPGNRDPKPEEVAACLPYLMRQIALLQPRLMLAVGRIAAQNLLSTDMPLGRLRGKVHHFGELNTPLIVTYHPAYLLRTPADKRKAWEDLKFARNVFRQLTDRQEPV
jgi:uracil-DNA glycosylase